MKTRIMLLMAIAILGVSTVNADNNLWLQHAYLINHHQIALGFTPQEVIRAIGQPIQTDSAIAASGHTDYWWYAGSFLVRFDNGVVSGIVQ
jgi:hypothetical protein